MPPQSTPLCIISTCDLCSFSEKENHVSPLESNSRGGLLACCYNFLKMKESGRQLLLGAHMDAAILPAALWLKSDFSRSGVSFSCWYGGPSDSDNWGNGLKLKSENPEAWFPGTKIEDWAFLDEFKQLVDLRIKPSLWEASSADSWWRWTSVITSGGRSTMGLMLSIRWLYLFPTIWGIECLYIES